MWDLLIRKEARFPEKGLNNHSRSAVATPSPSPKTVYSNDLLWEETLKHLDDYWIQILNRHWCVGGLKLYYDLQFRRMA